MKKKLKSGFSNCTLIVYDESPNISIKDIIFYKLYRCFFEDGKLCPVSFDVLLNSRRKEENDFSEWLCMKTVKGE